MAPHVDPSDYPRRWRFKRGTRQPLSGVSVTGAKFTNGVFEGPLPISSFDRLTFTRRIRIRFSWKSAKRGPWAIAEIELLGKRKALNDLWSFGKYPCKERLGIVTGLEGPTGELFYAAKNDRAPEVLEAVFSPAAEEFFEVFRRGWFFEYDGLDGVILGAELPERPLVQEVAVDVFRPRRNGKVKSFFLEGNMCESSCDKLGSEGWVTLEEVTGSRDDAIRLRVENPDTYKAYRVRVLPLKSTTDNTVPKAPGFLVRGIYFLACTL